MRRPLIVAALALFVASSCSPRDPKSSGIATPASTPTGIAFSVDASGVVHASNRLQGFDASLDRHGVTVAVGKERWSVRLSRFGRVGATHEVVEVAPSVVGARTTYARSVGLTEWYLNDRSGLEQGFDLARRPDGDGEVSFELQSSGLAPFLDGRGEIDLQDASGRTRLHYGALRVQDAKGRALSARLVVDGSVIALHVDDRDAEYPLVVDPLVWAASQKLTAGDGVPYDDFGATVGISGDTAVVGATGSGTGKGAAYVFTRTGITWTQQAKLTGSDSASGDGFGHVAIAGDTIVVGAPNKKVGANANQGAAYVFKRAGTVWTQAQQLTATDGAAGDMFGGAFGVAIDVNRLVVGAPGKTVSGHAGQGKVYVFDRPTTADSFVQTAQLVASDGADSDAFGSSVSVSGGTIAVGAPFHFTTGSERGAAYTFALSGTTWSQQARLTIGGSTSAYARVGESIALKSDYVVVGAPGHDSGKGSAAIWERVSGVWQNPTAPFNFQPVDLGADDAFGSSVAFDVSGAYAQFAYGAPGRTVGTNTWQGAIYILEGTGDGKFYTNSAGTAAYDAFGNSIAMTADTAIAGAIHYNTQQGAAYVFTFSLQQGDACTASRECGSGFCIDGKCCDTACSGKCQACSAAKKGAGADGACGPIKDGTDPDVECPGQTCASGVVEVGHVCNGSGACRFTTTSSCGLYACNAAATACAAGCTTNANCAPTAYCKAGACVTKLANGGACSATDGSECASGFCVDGVCCNVACNGLCEACSAAANGGVDGTCAAVPDGKDPRKACPGSACASGVETSNVCNGARGCRPNPISCAPYACDATGKICARACTGDGDCGSGAFCDSTSTCAPKHTPGTSCTAARECASNFCVDGVCCNEACNGACQACDLASSRGTCSLVTGAPHTGHTACPGTGVCAGTCDGSSPSCAMPGATTSCGTTCSGSQEIDSACDGSGNCVATPPKPCGGYACGASKCNSECTTASDCATGYVCAADHTCSPKPPAKCSDDRTSSVGPDGETPCGAYRCEASTGTCPKTCASTDNCAPGYLCGEGNVCVPNAPPTDDAGGCAMGPSSRASINAAAALVMFGLVVARRRRNAATR